MLHGSWQGHGNGNDRRHLRQLHPEREQQIAQMRQMFAAEFM